MPIYVCLEHQTIALALPAHCPTCNEPMPAYLRPDEISPTLAAAVLAKNSHVSSPARTEHLREIAKLPRPNAKGKKKPRKVKA